MKKLKEIDVKENQKKAEKVREFRESRITISKKNYQQKLIKTIRERDRADSALERLKEE